MIRFAIARTLRKVSGSRPINGSHDLMSSHYSSLHRILRQFSFCSASQSQKLSANATRISRIQHHDFRHSRIAPALLLLALLAQCQNQSAQAEPRVDGPISIAGDAIRKEIRVDGKSWVLCYFVRQRGELWVYDCLNVTTYLFVAP
jgi:hypothetical protein